MASDWIGHAVTLLDEPRSRHLCTKCKRIMLDPVQAICGHLFCAKCGRDIMQSDSPCCSSDNKPMIEEEVFPDYACRREISNIKVECLNRSLGCSWQGILKRLPVHLEECEFRDQQCELCDKMVRYGTMSHHSSHECPMREVECDYCNMKILDILLNTHVAIKCPDVLRACPNECDISLRMKLEELEKHLAVVGGKCPLVEVDCPFSVFGCHFKNTRVMVEAHVATSTMTHMHMQIDSIKSTSDSLNSVCTRVARMTQKVYDIEESLGHHARTVDSLKSVQEGLDSKYTVFVSDVQRKLDTFTSEYISGRNVPSSPNPVMVPSRNSEMDTFYNVKSISDKIDAVSADVSNLKITMGMMATSYNGILMWRINSFTERMDKAKRGNCESISSIPFYTDHNGYRLGAKMMLNGDGKGKNSHMSLYLILLRNTFDDFLTWPFNKKCEMILINQNGLSDHSKTLIPDARPAFNRPKFLANSGIGFSTFICHSKLNSGGFVERDSILIKIVVSDRDL